MRGNYLAPGGAIGALNPEHSLALAVLRQAVLDARSRREAVRAEAAQFWADDQAVSFWADLFDIETDRLRAAVTRLSAWL
jgi:hypothetical protein